MNKTARIAVVVGLALVIGVVIATKREKEPVSPAADETQPAHPAHAARDGQPGLPRLLELGSVSCIPCKMMAPILDELRKEYPGSLQVDFIDVNLDREAAMKYGIRMIPTQVFLSAEGKELFRHEGFFPKEEILSKWKEVGIDLDSLRQEEPPEPPQTESKGNT